MTCRPTMTAHHHSMEKKMLFTLALFAAAPAGAQDFQSTVALDAIVAQFTGKAIGAQGGATAPVDRRLRLTPCAAPQLDWRSESHDAVVVRCMAPQWKIFVPVVAVPKPKAVPAAGAAPAVALRPTPTVKAEPVIRRGDAVTIEAGAEGFSISRQGIAMGDAPAGGRLPVKVDERQPPLQTIAIEPGRARLPGWNEGS